MLARGELDRCGVTLPAGMAVGAAFVGAAAATLVIAEVLRLLDGGPIHKFIDGIVIPGVGAGAERFQHPQSGLRSSSILTPAAGPRLTLIAHGPQFRAGTSEILMWHLQKGVVPQMGPDKIVPPVAMDSLSATSPS